MECFVLLKALKNGWIKITSFQNNVPVTLDNLHRTPRTQFPVELLSTKEMVSMQPLDSVFSWLTVSPFLVKDVAVDFLILIFKVSTTDLFTSTELGGGRNLKTLANNLSASATRGRSENSLGEPTLYFCLIPGRNNIQYMEMLWTKYLCAACSLQLNESVWWLRVHSEI